MATLPSRMVRAQADFGWCLAQLVTWARAEGLVITLGELERPAELAAIYAADGRGIMDSQHRDRLAVDVHRYIDGDWTDQADDYAELGEVRERLDTRARWGGRFTRRDGHHFEFRGISL